MTTAGHEPRGTGLLMGDVARLSGLTPRAIRLYHAQGLVPEPDRDTSGYRRYRAADVIALVRVARLRSLGMPLSQIRERVSAPAGTDPNDDLQALAKDLGDQIQRLNELRERLQQAITSRDMDDPAGVLTAALRSRGLLGNTDQLDPREAEAARLINALHPAGIAGALDTAHFVLEDDAARNALAALIQRCRSLGEDSSDAEIDALVAQALALFPRPDNAPIPIDLDAMKALLGSRLTSGQRRFMQRLRTPLRDRDA